MRIFTLLVSGLLLMSAASLAGDDPTTTSAPHGASTQLAADAHAKHADIAEGEPQVNEKYNIYHFFLRDPEGRKLEVQRFLDL